MRKLRILPLILGFCLLITLFPITLVAETTHSTLSGTISLPDKDDAPSGGVKLTLQVFTDNGSSSNQDDVSVTQVLTIPKGKDSLSYSIMVPKSSNKNARYGVSYTIGNGYAPFGYYSSKGTTAIKANQTLVDLNAGNKNSVNIEILPGRKISGEITLGNPETKPSNDLPFMVTAIQEGSKANTTDDDIIITKEVAIEKGEDKASYSMIVPVNTAGNGYKLYYQYSNGTYKETGYYNVNGTSRNENKVTLIDVNNNVSGMNLTTLPFTNISGKVYLPEEDKAPDDGIEVTVTAFFNGVLTTKSDDFIIRHTVTIPEDRHSTGYSLTVPVKDAGYILNYSVKANTGYVSEGYYSVNGTQTSKSRATVVDTDEDALTGINLSILNTSRTKPTPTPKPDEKYDLNNDGSINVFDLLELARVIVDQYDKDSYWENFKKSNQGETLDKEDLDVLKDAFKPFDNNRVQMKWFNNINQWYKNWNWSWGWGNSYNGYDWNDWKNWGGMDEDAWKQWYENWDKKWDDEDWDDWKEWYKNGYNDWYENKGNKRKK